MSAVNHAIATKPDAATVLSKAVARAAERLNISRALLAKELGVSPATVSRLHKLVADYAQRVDLTGTASA